MPQFSNVLHNAINVAEAREVDGVYIVPIIPTMEGVMNGAFKSKDELAKSMGTAFRMVVTDTHPFWGIVTQPDEIVGTTVKHTLGTDGKMRAEMHINIEEQPATVEKLKSGLYSDLSTGYWADTEYDIEPFDFNGKTATYNETNIVWDHLAILPNGAAACDQEMGCGSYLNEVQDKEPEKEGELKEKIEMTEETDTDVKNDCADAIAEVQARNDALHGEYKEQMAALTSTLNTFMETMKNRVEEPAEPKPAVNTEGSGAPLTVPTTGGVKPVEEPVINTEKNDAEPPMEVDMLLADGSRYQGPISEGLKDYMLNGTTTSMRRK